jgi:hypothetical protein
MREDTHERRREDRIRIYERKRGYLTDAGDEERVQNRPPGVKERLPVRLTGEEKCIG